MMFFRSFSIIALLVIPAVSACKAESASTPATDKKAEVQKRIKIKANKGITEVTMQTSLGEIKLALFVDKAPLSVANFLRYIEKGHYNDVIFHRVIDGFMIQGGGFTKEIIQKPVDAPIKNEANNGLKNFRGTLTMARSQAPDSATSQFFINLKDNDFLNHRSMDMRGMGYAVFGEVISGMKVVDKIAKVETDCPSQPRAPCNRPDLHGMRDVPKKPVIIKKISIN